MAISFPNYLSAQLVNPDYSGIGDSVSNYYAGRAMPKDDLMKQIQAQFARPNAEQNLQTARLGNVSSMLTNDKTRLEIAKLKRDQALEDQFQQQFRTALGGGSIAPSNAPQMPQGVSMGQNNLPMQAPPMSQSAMPNAQQINPALAQAFSRNGAAAPTDLSAALPMRTGANAPNAPNAPAPIAPNAMQSPQSSQAAPASALAAPETAEPADQMPQEQVLVQGNPALAGVDALWDRSPLSQEFLKKKGYEKKTDTKFDSKTGQTRITTTYPSGKETVKVFGANRGEEGIPLTQKMVTKHQNIISSIDNALPTIQEILKEGKGFQPYPRSTGWVPKMGLVPGFMSQAVKYEAQVNSILDSLVGAYGLPSTNEGIDTVKSQLLIGHTETVANYKRRLKKLVSDLERRRAYSSNEVKKSNKIQPIATMGSDSDGSSFSSDQWEQV